MSVHRVDVDHIAMQFERPYPAGKKRLKERHLLILRVYEEEWIGIGEVTLPLEDFYHQEAESVVEAAWREMTESVLDRFFHFPEENFEEDLTALSKIDADPALLCGLETALWDLEGQKRNQPLHKMLGARQTIVLAGLETHPDATSDIIISQLDRYLKSDGYRRVKVAIHPDNPVELLRVLRKNLPPNLKIAADAGGRFKPDELKVLSRMEDYHLDFLQDPFAPDTPDKVYEELNELLPNTPICLGKQFKDPESLRQAADKELCQVACLIPSRLGGIQATRQLARWMQQEGFSAWMGSECESGIGTTAGVSLILNSLKEMTRPIMGM